MKQISHKQIYMATIATELTQWLSDPPKQDRIEIKIINRLHRLDPNFVFLNAFHKALLKCNTFRTPHLNSEGKEVYDVTTKASQEIPSEKFRDTLPAVQSVLASFIGPIITQEIICNLYNLPNQSLSLRLV